MATNLENKQHEYILFLQEQLNIYESALSTQSWWSVSQDIVDKGSNLRAEIVEIISKNNIMKITVLKGKHGNSYFRTETQEEKFASALKIFDINREYYNFPDSDKLIAEEIDKTRDGKTALNLIWNRSSASYEYEELEMETVQ